MANDIIIPGYETSIGSKLLVLVDHFGPTSYNAATGDVYTAKNINRGGFDRVLAGASLSGTYSVMPVYGAGAKGMGVSSVSLKWSVVTSGVVSGTTITAAGVYTGTAPTITFSAAPAGGVTATGTGVLNVAGTALVGIIINNPGSGYVTAPTVTVATGGGTATASITNSPGPVANGTNLSAEAVRLELIAY